MTNGYTSLHRSRYCCHLAVKDGEVYIYDNSGDNPDETDDGPLVVAQDKLEEAGAIQCRPSNYGPDARIPVRCKGDPWRLYTASTDLEGAIKLGRRLGLKVDMVTNIYDPKPKS